MNSKRKIIALVILGSILGLSGCNSGEDVTESDSLYVKANTYQAPQFSVGKDKQVKVKASLQGGNPIEAYILDEEDYRQWVATTQNGDFGNASLVYIKSITPLNGVHETDWFALAEGNYHILFENTAFSAIKPTLAGETSSVSYSVLTQAVPTKSE